jgi:hypothetical protein
MEKQKTEDDFIRIAVQQRNRLSIVCEASKKKTHKDKRQEMAKGSLWVESLGTLQLISFLTDF